MNYESFKQEMKSEQKMNPKYEDYKMDSFSMASNMGCCGGMMAQPMMSAPMMGASCPPVYECPQENVCHRYICYDVPHIMPCNTRIINHHIYRHTYRPEYTCCEENVVQNVYDRQCC